MLFFRAITQLQAYKLIALLKGYFTGENENGGVGGELNGIYDTISLSTILTGTTGIHIALALHIKIPTTFPSNPPDPHLSLS